MKPPPFIERLPRDIEYQDRWLTELYRSNSQGGPGRIVYLRNSRPGIATGHVTMVFEVNVSDDGKEQLGNCLLVTPNADIAIELAGKNVNQPQ